MTIPLRLLIAMDSEDDALLAVRELQRAGYDPEWDRVESAKAFADKLDGGTWDVVISDYAIPGIGGLEALAMARQKDPDLPVILLSRGIGEEAAVEAIKAGASDCILTDRLDRLPAAVGRALRDSELLRSRRAAEAGLREKTAFYSDLIEKARDGIVVTDLNARIKSCNKSFLDIIGIEGIEDAVGLSLLDITPPEYHERELGLVREQAFTRGYTDIFEKEYIRPDGRLIPVSVRIRLRHDAEGKPLEALGLVRDISEQNSARRAFEESAQLYRLLTENANDVIWSCDLDMTLRYVSPSVEKLHGWTPGEVIEAGVTMTLPPESLRLAAAKLQEFLDGHRTGSRSESVTFEIEQNRKDGTRVWTELSASPFFDDDGRMAGISGVTRDISERKKAENALLRSQQEWERTFDSVPDLIAILDDRHRIVKVNRALAERIGLTPGQCIGKTCYESIHGVMEPIASCPHALSLADGHEHTTEVREEKLGGDFLVSCTPLLDEQGARIGSVHVARDITERKHDAEALRQSEEKFRGIFENTLVGIFQSTPEGRYITVNPACARMFGYASPEEMITSVTDIGRQLYWDPEERRRCIETLESSGTLERFEVKCRKKDGSPIRTVINSRVVRDEAGNLLLIEGVIEDITSRKRAEEALRESERFNSAIISGASEGIVVYDTDLRYVVWNRFMENLTGMKSEDVLGHRATDLFSHVREQGIEQIMNRALRGETVSSEDIPFHAPQTGKTGWVQSTFSPHVNARGEIIGVIGMIRDVTEHQAIEASLRQSEERFSKAFRSSPAMEAITDLNDGRIIDVNNKWLEALGYTREEVIGRSTTDIGVWADPQERRNILLQLKEKKRFRDVHVHTRTKSGEIRDIHISGEIIRTGNEDFFLSLGRDVTDTLKTEKDLRESENRFRLLIENAPDGIYVQTQGCIVYVNDTALRMFGARSPDDLLGRSFLDLVHPDFRDQVRERARIVNEEKRTVAAQEQVYVKLDGTPMEVEVSVVPIRYEAHDGALVFIRDISERKRAEKALRESESRYRSLFENMLEGYACCRMLFECDTPHDFVYIDVNSAFEKLTGLKNVIGRKVSELIPGFRESNPEMLKTYGRVAKTGKPERLETYVEPLGMWFSVSVYSPQREHFVAVFDVITDRKLAEQKLQEAHNRLDQIIEYLPDATFVIDADRNVIAWNRAIEQMTGISKAQMIGKGNYEYALPFYGERRPIIIDLAFLPDEEFEKRKYDAIHRFADALYGEVYVPITYGGVGAYLSATASRLRDASGNVIGAIETIRDITDRKKAEKALNAALAKREELEAIISQSPIVVVLYRMEKGYPTEYVSPSVIQYGYDPEDFTSGRIGILDVIHPDDVDKVLEEAQMNLRMGCDDITQDYRVRTAWGDYQWVLNRTRMRRDRNGLVTHGQAIIYDITDRKRAEIALRESGRQMRALLDNIPDIVWLKDSESRYIAVNEPFGKTCGFKPEELAGKTDLDIWPKDLAETYRADDAEVIQSGRPKRVEEFLEDAAGKRNWIETVKTPIRNDRGDVIGTTGIARDITERKSVEDLYRMLSDKSLAGVYVVQEGVFKYINTNAASYAGYTAAELVGRRSTFLVHPEDGHIARKYSREMLRGIHQTPYEFRIIDKAGRIRWILETVTTIPYEGTPAILGNSMDITQLKEAQQKLEELLALESSVLSAIPLAVVGLENRRIIFANDNVETVFGWKPAEIIGGDLAVFFSSEAACEAVTRRIATALQNGKVYSLEPEHPLVHRDGRAQDCRVTAARIGNGSGESLVATFEDITDRKRAQLQILQSEKMASIGQLAAGVAHEINNPTGYVSSNLKTLSEYFEDVMGIMLRYRALLSGVRELVEKAKLDGNLAGLVGDIEAMEQKVDIDYILKDAPSLIHESREGTERIKEIVLSLKNFAHPGEVRFSYSDVHKNLDSTLNVVWNELKYKTTVRKEYGELPEIECYPQQINQVFMNMLVNAAQAIKVKGEIAIRTRSLGDVVEISISDTGVGIPEENLARIFDPFFTTKEVGKGTGLGLNVAYNIVKKHRGAIDVKSKIGEGTTFTIRLPVHQAEAMA